MGKDLDDCVEELAQLCKGTHLDREACRVLEALAHGYCMYHPYPERDLDKDA